MIHGARLDVSGRECLDSEYILEPLRVLGSGSSDTVHRHVRFAPPSTPAAVHRNSPCHTRFVRVAVPRVLTFA